LPITGAAEESLSAADLSVTGHSALSATEYAPYGVEHERQVATAIISGEKSATGPIASIVTDRPFISTIQPDKFAVPRKEINRIMRSAFAASPDDGNS
jgi:hypothetical protein